MSSIHTGFLIVEDGKVRGGKRRYCKLERTFLFYTGKTKNFSRPSGVIDLSGSTLSLPTNSPYENQFIIHNTARYKTYHLTAETEQEMKQWMDSIKLAIDAESNIIMEYKGKAIYDTEDALVISRSISSVHSFVQEEYEKCKKTMENVNEETIKLVQEVQKLKEKKKILTEEVSLQIVICFALVICVLFRLTNHFLLFFCFLIF